MIGARIKEARKRIKMTQPELAEKIGVHETTVRRWERDKDNGPSAEILKRIAEALGTTADYLLKGESEPPQPSEESQLKQLLDNIVSSLAKDNNKDSDINKEESNGNAKIKDPLFGTYEPNTRNEFELAYWGGVVDNAQRVAKNGNAQDKEMALMMLRMAENAIAGAEGKPTTERTFIGVQGNNNEIKNNNLNVRTGG